MTDFNGRISEIVRAFEKYPADAGEVRYAIRKILRAEHADGWNEGYGDGQEDLYAKIRASEKAAEGQDDDDD